MYCTQCGTKMDEGFKFCPECGAKVVVPSQEKSNEQDVYDTNADAKKDLGYSYCPNRKSNKAYTDVELDEIADEIFVEFFSQKTKGIIEFQKRTGVDLRIAKKIMEDRYNNPDYQDLISESRQQLRKEEKEEWAVHVQNAMSAMDERKAIKKAEKRSNKGVAHCPRCKSTSISYTGKELSVGRGVVGYGLAGPAGAILGGLSSKKGYAVCLKCGKRWKI